MKKLITMLMLTFATLSSQATLLSVDFDDTSYHVGDVLTANIVVSDIEKDASALTKLVASFNTDLLFDESFLTFSTVIFGDKLDVDPEPFFASIQESNLISTSRLRIQEIAQAFSFDLFAAQDGFNNFVLATVNFTVLKSGISSLHLANVNIGDDVGDSFTDVHTASKNFTVVDSVSVPEPSTLILFITACVALFTRRIQ